jgi:hypothetical protein
MKGSEFTEAQKSFIREEITKQLRSLKKQIDIEISSDLEKLDAKFAAALSEATKKAADDVTRVRSEVDAKVDTAKNQIVATNSNQLAVVRESNRKMLQEVGQQITNATYKKVVAEINRELVPKLNGMVEYVNYQMQDTTELVTDYRRAVNDQVNGGQKYITDGNNKGIISEHVSMFFRDEE